MKIGPWELEVDVESTQRAHAETYSSAERCGCAYCRNFVAVRDKTLPRKFIDILEQLGVNYRKDSEIYETHKRADGTHGYGGWYHAVGTVLSGPNEHSESLGKRFWYWVSNRAHLVRKGFPLPAFQIEFGTTLPWVIDEQP